MMSLIRTLVALALVLVFVVPSADAQRRRRRRRPTPTPPPAEPAETPEEEEAPETPVAEADAEAEVEPADPIEPIAEPEPVAPPAPESTPPPDLSPLRSELATLMDELVQTRARVAVLGRQLFETKVRVRVENRADDAVLATFSLRLDGAPVFVMSDRLGDDGVTVFEGFAAPGPHELTVEAEQRTRANADYRYLQSDRYRFEVVQGQMTDVVIILDDDSDIGEDFADDGEGEYDVRTRVRVATRALEDEG